VATKIRRIDEEIDVRVSWPEEFRQNSDSLGQILVPNPFGNLIPLERVAQFKTTRNLSLHSHEANSRQVLVTAEVDDRVISSVEANNQVRLKLSKLHKDHPNVRIEFGGEDEDTQESLASLSRSFGVAVLLIFLMLVLILKSLSQPLLVMLTIPMGITCVIWTFFLHRMPLSFLGMLGVIALAGVIVNNAIILIDFYNQHRLKGLAPEESILEASRQRIRPIVMTTLTTVMGVLPTAYGIGGIDQFVVPIAMALGWGLLFGSIMTVVIFPCAVLTLEDLILKIKTRSL
jgi:multidrug efflux pump subunit AcrB